MKSTTVRTLIVDELDEFAANLHSGDDPVKMLDGRTSAYPGSYKRLYISTPTLAGLSRIDELFNKGDQRHYHVPCPHCGHFQALKIEQLLDAFGLEAVFLDTVHAWTNDPNSNVFEGVRALVERLRAHTAGLLLAGEADYDALPNIPDHRRRVYAAMVKSVDRSVGRVLQTLREEGLDDNTIVIFTSDNGGYM